ncbi:gag-pol polyprotein [Tanacetum coccineum]
MEADMLKAQSKVVDILCNLELIYPPAFFDIMIHLVIHLPLEALKGGPIRPRWMYPFERFMKKLKKYVRNKAKLKGSIAKGYVAEEALNFSPYYFRDVTTKLNRPDRNVDFPPLTFNGVRFFVHNRDERRTTQNSSICSPGEKDGEMYYGQHDEILEFSYMSFKFVLFRVKWFDTSNEGRKVKRFVIRNNITQIWANGESFKDDQYIPATQVKQVFYLEDMARRPPNWKVVKDVNHKKFSNGGVIVVEDDHDVIHFDNSSNLALSTSLNDLDFATLHIDSQSMDVDAPPDIIDVDEDDDSINDEDALPHDLANSDDEDLANDDDDDVDVMSAYVARGHDGDGGDDDRKGTRIPNRGGQKVGRLDTRAPTRNLGLRSITDKSGPVKIWFEFSDRGTLMPLGDHAAHWSNLLGEIVREFPMHYPAWRKIEPERKAGVMGLIWAQFDLAPHMQSDHSPDIYKGIHQQLAKIYTDNKLALKKEHWVAKLDGTYDVEVIRSRRPANISQADWDAQIRFWLDPKNAS